MLDTFVGITGDEEIKIVTRPIEVIDEMITQMKSEGLEVIDK